jgi:hypothetical protein
MAAPVGLIRWFCGDSCRNRIPFLIEKIEKILFLVERLGASRESRCHGIKPSGIGVSEQSTPRSVVIEGDDLPRGPAGRRG